ncbi:MAG: acetoin dehydrogenase dihydrolipoyllysine-residue acetyltransferase subunit [Roseitalea sp.]|jgi:pyruvate dehydrogenase E2 component (dihydrolipoamide acetyltransferase)|nr:acetoin dehydrogenase dihydrolipoyllysine-residue acetyltransferase subunit [Roseitalea sp.]MBO6721694.1 acetoin dehydrogenase dihydrolipoyllysine-residue acetyltransferase subunit [Roseitalea sp.]MBO6743517.1 acetoin dehydrogenase dihydrolipoyllysine-residue acetyltransferase subunit [Roseitalea sp.]
MSEALLTMPRLGETMERGEIVGWLVDVGQSFARGDPLIEVETDKTVVEFPALGAGTLTERLAEVGETVEVGAPIARVDVGDGPDWTANDDAGDQGNAETGAAPETGDEAQAEPAAGSATETDADLVPARPGAGHVRATPVARRLARRQGIDLATLAGSGRRGRIDARDVVGAGQGGSDDLRFANGIAYTEKGPATGEPFLLIHGFAGDRTTFASLINGLAKAGRHVVAIDLPGHGATEHEAPDIGALAAPLADFIRALFGERPFHLVAHSLGAVPAVALVRKCPVLSLSLIAPAGVGLSINADFVAGMADPSSAGEVAHLLRMLTDTPANLSESAIADIFNVQKRRRLGKLAGQMVGRQGQTVSIIDVLRRLSADIPVRMLVGHRDRIFDWRDATGLSPRIAIHHFPRAGHMPHAEAPRDTLDILLSGNGGRPMP